jgi:hypothetical protein
MEFRTYFGTRKFVTVLSRALYWSLSWAKSIQPTLLHPSSVRSTLTLSSHLILGLSIYVFSSFLRMYCMHTFRLSHACSVTCGRENVVLINRYDLTWISLIKLCLSTLVDCGGSSWSDTFFRVPKGSRIINLWTVRIVEFIWTVSVGLCMHKKCPHMHMMLQRDTPTALSIWNPFS